MKFSSTIVAAVVAAAACHQTHEKTCFVYSFQSSIAKAKSSSMVVRQQQSTNKIDNSNSNAQEKQLNSMSFGLSSSRSTTVRLSLSTTAATPTTSEQQQDNSDNNVGVVVSSKKNDRLNMMKKSTFHRNGFKEVRTDVEQTMVQQFKGTIVDELKTSNYSIERDGVKVYLAKDFGFCWGVERSIALAYEAVNHFQKEDQDSGTKRTIHITNELIHNPEVHENLINMNVQLLEKVGGTMATTGSNAKNFDKVQDNDIVILPAFGASYEEMKLLDSKNVQVVDTTCPWVSKVWNTVDKHQKAGHTSIIHGKYSHEETVATASFCENYICVKDMKEAQIVADYISQLNKSNELTKEQQEQMDQEFLSKFNPSAMSIGFQPRTMLQKVGLANQTTMYKKETRAIGQLLQKTILSTYGPLEFKNRYMEFDTICDATQERQDAIHELVDNAEAYGLDFILVVGGFDSSNTAHLLEIPHHAGIKSYHINRADCISADNTITHRLVDGTIVTEPFLYDLDKDIVMGVTSGASTPDKAVQDSLSNIFMLKQLHAKATAAAV